MTLDLRYLARLARIPLSPEEERRLAGEVEEALARANVLMELPEAEAEEGRGGGLREDVVGSEPLRLPLSEVSPRWSDGFFLLPRPAALGDPDAAG